MSLLWVTAVINGHDYGEPTLEHVQRTAHEYLRAHYDDRYPDEPDLHDHFEKRPNGTHGQYTAWSSCKWPCTHGPTMERVKGLAQQSWDFEHQRLFHPEDAQADQDRRSAVPFLNDYALEHPDRVFPWNPDNTLGEPDDPRLKGS